MKIFFSLFFRFYLIFVVNFAVGIQIRLGKINNKVVLHKRVFRYHEISVHIRQQQQIHGILMHHGIKDNRIMHIPPLQVIKMIRVALPLPKAINRMVHKANKLAMHRHPNSINQKIQKHHKFWSIHCYDRAMVDRLHWSRGVYAIRFIICARKQCPIVVQKNIAIGTDSHLSCRWFGFHFTRI